jgi:hypothetical protein
MLRPLFFSNDSAVSTEPWRAPNVLLMFLLVCVGITGACSRTCPKGLVISNGQCVRATEQSLEEGAETNEAGVGGQEPKSAAGDGGAGSTVADSGRPARQVGGSQSLASAAAGKGGGAAESSEGAGAKSPATPDMSAANSGMRSCLVGATRCDAAGAAVEVCTLADTWMMKEVCSGTCKDGACAGECKPGSKHCGAQQIVETCSMLGAWTPGDTCPFVCSGSGECRGECLPGSKQCGGSDGRTVQTCDESGHWLDESSCSSVCSGGSCTGTCTPGSRRCRTSLTPEICSDSGSWEPQLDCSFLCSGQGQCTGECRPGSKQCTGQTPEICDPAGHWAADIPCINSACVNGVCGGACAPGERRCGPVQTPQLCNDSGVWTPGRACQYVCSGAGECTGSCSPNTKVCSGSTLRACKADGSGYADTACQPAQANETASCSGNMCVSRCESPALKCGTSPLCWRLEYGCESCASPYVWREATTSDKTCVTEESRTRTKAENNNAMYPIAATCPSGLVWREATPDDKRCVPAEIRTIVSNENRMSAGNTVVSRGVQP